MAGPAGLDITPTVTVGSGRGFNNEKFGDRQKNKLGAQTSNTSGVSSTEGLDNQSNKTNTIIKQYT